MGKKRKLTAQEIEVFYYLNDLKDSGVTNMFGAGAYVREVFEVSKLEAWRLLGLWMDNFNEDVETYKTLEIEI